MTVKISKLNGIACSLGLEFSSLWLWITASFVSQHFRSCCIFFILQWILFPPEVPNLPLNSKTTELQLVSLHYSYYLIESVIKSCQVNKALKQTTISLTGWENNVDKQKTGSWWLHKPGSSQQVRGEVVLVSSKSNWQKGALSAGSPPSICVHAPTWRPHAGRHF